MLYLLILVFHFVKITELSFSLPEDMQERAYMQRKAEDAELRTVRISQISILMARKHGQEV